MFFVYEGVPELRPAQEEFVQGVPELRGGIRSTCMKSGAQTCPEFSRAQTWPDATKNKGSGAQTCLGGICSTCMKGFQSSDLFRRSLFYLYEGVWSSDLCRRNWLYLCEGVPDLRPAQEDCVLYLYEGGPELSAWRGAALGQKDQPESARPQSARPPVILAGIHMAARTPPLLQISGSAAPAGKRFGPSLARDLRAYIHEDLRRGFCYIGRAPVDT